MSAQLSILVKNESFLSRLMSFLWFINIFKKMSVIATIDGDQANAVQLKANKEPYVLDLTPGYHQVVFTDPRAAGKQAFRSFNNAIMGGIMSLSTDGAINSSDFSGWGGAAKDGVLQCNLEDGSLLKVSAKPKNNGSVKVKILKK